MKYNLKGRGGEERRVERQRGREGDERWEGETGREGRGGGRREGDGGGVGWGLYIFLFY